MSNATKYGRRALVLVMFGALGVMAFAATSAQAQTTGWLLNGSFITVTKEVSAAIHPLADGKKHSVLLTTIGATNTPIEVLCEVLKVDDGLIFAGAAPEGLAILLYTECKTFLNKSATESKPCKPQEPITAEVKFHAILHTSKEAEDKGDGKTYLLFQPEKELFTTILLGPSVGNECSVGTKIPIKGELVAECLNESLEKNGSLTDYCLENLTHHLIQEAPKKLFLLEGTIPSEKKYDELKFEAREATLDGITSISDVGGGTLGVHI